MMPMKGLLKGLRYISQIFESEKEEEIHIGNPTDVKHVAHIGMDGPSANTPSWMNKYNANSETTPVPPDGDTKHKPSIKSVAEDSTERNTRDPQKSSSGSLDSPTQRSSNKTRQSRRNHSSNNSTGSVDGDSSINLSKPRRHKQSGEIGSPKSDRTRRVQTQNTGSDSPSNPPRVPKSHRKKSKESSGSGSMKSLRTKVTDPLSEISPYSDPGNDPGFKNIEVYSNNVHGEGNECEEISKGIHGL